MKPFNPGDFRTAILIQRRTTTQDAGGFTAAAWVTVAACWAKWRNVHGSEVWAAQMANALQPATVTVRYNAAIDATCAVSKNGVLYEIVSLDDIEERHEYIELKIKRIVEA
jgi:SPP1 family predicted phage head-tail adaptor